MSDDQRVVNKVNATLIVAKMMNDMNWAFEKLVSKLNSTHKTLRKIGINTTIVNLINSRMNLSVK